MAAPAPITGTLAKPGYTVIALAPTGEARTVVARAGAFSIVPPAEAATLHLRAPDGTYAGPLVLDEKGAVSRARATVSKAKRRATRARRKFRSARRNARQAAGTPIEIRAAKRLKRAKARLRKARRRVRKAKRLLQVARQEEAARETAAIVGVRAGAPLGAIAIDSAAGFALAELPGRSWATSVDTERTAQALDGVPIGAGNFGYVASRPAAGVVRGDLDLDGVPEPLDIDDDGDLILDELDSSPRGGRAAAAQGFGCGPANIYCPAVSSGLGLFLQDTVNANAGSTIAQIDAALRSFGGLRFDVTRDGLAGHDGLAELDCGDPDTGLVYCRQNGSTATSSAGAPGGPPFPGQPGGTFDADSDGFGLLDPALQPEACGGGCPTNFFLLHGAASQQIGSGDLLVEHITTSGDPSQCPPPPGVVNDACVSITTPLQYVFATVPALVRYGDTAGNSTAVSYPVPPGGPGTFENGFPVSPGADGDIRVRMTFWRPQRRAIPDADPPTATWMDIGRLTYGVSIDSADRPFCPQAAFSEDDPATPDVVEDDPNLSVATPHVFLQGGGGFDDAKRDEPSAPGDTSPGRTFSYTLNLSHCLASHGIAFGTGDELLFRFHAAPGAPSGSEQNVYFKRQ